MTRALTDSSGWTEQRMEHGSVLRTGAVVGSYLTIRRRLRWLIGLGVSSICLAWLIAHGGGLGVAIALALLPVAAVVLAPSENRLLVGAAMVVLLPWWYTFGSSQLKAFVVASLLAMTALLGVGATQSRAHQRLNFIDLALAGVVTATALSLAFVGPYTSDSLRAVILWALPLGFYVSARAFGSREWRSVCWVLLIGGTVASGPLFYEFFVIHRPLFGSPSTYLWSAQPGGLFRPAGSFGGPPEAVTVLSMTTLCGLSLLVTSVGARRLIIWLCLAVSVGGMIITFTRAGLIGFALGVMIFVALWRPAALGRLAFATAAASVIFLLAVLPHLASKAWYEGGVTRHGNLADRELRWRAAWPVITNSTKHLVFGHGFNSLLVGHPNGLTGEPQADLAAVPILIKESPHSQYVRTLLEQGIVGLALVLAWLLGSVGKAVAAVRRATEHDEGPALLAGCAAGIVSFLVVSLAGDGLREVPSLAIVALLSGLTAAGARHVTRQTA
jgi:O-antigen ligase